MYGSAAPGISRLAYRLPRAHLVLSQLEHERRLVTDAAGGRHPWAADLAAELVRRQEGDGAWVNRNPRWLEDNRDLVTAYALLALSRCVPFLG